MAYSAIKFDVDKDGIATLTLNRPDKLNCFSQDMFREWREVVEKCAYDPKVRVLVVTGAGRAFSSGVDIEVLGSDKTPAEFRFYYRQNHRGFDDLEALEKPVIAAVHGVCYGGGVELALSCDIVFAADDARFCLIENHIGCIPATGACNRLIHWVGLAKTKEMVMSAAPIDAAEAHRIGLANHVVPRAKMMDEVYAYARKLTLNASEAMGMGKHVINLCLNTDMHTGRFLERLAQSALVQSPQHAEGMQAFREKRKPQVRRQVTKERPMLSIERILPRARKLYRDRPAVNRNGVWLTFEQLGQRVDALAAGLASLGTQRGDRVALLDFNSAEYLEVYYAAAQAGFIFVPLNSRLAAPELKYILNDCGAKVLIASKPFFAMLETLRGQLPSVSSVVTCGAGPAGTVDYEELASSGKVNAVVSPAPGDIAQIYYTSGTTGEPKGVCLTHENMTVSAVDSAIGLGLDWCDSWLHSAPLFHLVDAWAVWAMPLLGAPQIPLHFTPDNFLTVVEKLKPTATALPPTLISLICSQPKLQSTDLSSLRLIMYGGSPMPLGVLSRAMDVLPTSYMHAYGITETSGITTLLRPESILPRGTPDEIKITGSAGHPVASIGVEIMDDANKVLPDGEVGEIVVSGPRLMAEYWKKPKATADAIRDGWYHTGDLGYFDDQRNLHVVDRKKDMIITGGENVYSVEVENVLSTHPDVLECAVIGVPSKEWGEAVHAVIVARDQKSLAADDIAAYCRGKIANYKIPKSVSFSPDALPKTGPGKIAKRQIRDVFWQNQTTKI